MTKLPPGGMRPEGVTKYLQKSLDLLQTSYVDLYLVHTPFGFKDIEGEVHPFTADGKIILDLDTDHIAIWKVILKLYPHWHVVNSFNQSGYGRTSG